jgi:hypothetical protein
MIFFPGYKKQKDRQPDPGYEDDGKCDIGLEFEAEKCRNRHIIQRKQQDFGIRKDNQLCAYCPLIIEWLKENEGFEYQNKESKSKPVDIKKQKKQKKEIKILVKKAKKKNNKPRGLCKICKKVGSLTSKTSETCQYCYQKQRGYYGKKKKSAPKTGAKQKAIHVTAETVQVIDPKDLKPDFKPFEECLDELSLSIFERKEEIYALEARLQREKLALSIYEHQKIKLSNALKKVKSA